MKLKKRYLLKDPGFSQLLLGLRAVSILACLFIANFFFFALSNITVIFVAMATIFALVNLYALTKKDHFISAIRASFLLYAAAVLGLYFPFTDLFKVPLFLIFVFLSYFVTRFGQRWFFHPVVASIMFMVTMSLSGPDLEKDSVIVFSQFCLFALGLSLFFQFVIFKNQIFFGAAHSFWSVLNCLEMTYSKVESDRRQAKKIWKKANGRTNQLIQFGKRLEKNFQQRKDMELLVIELYGLVRLTLNLLDSIKELEVTLFVHNNFKEAVFSLLNNLKKAASNLVNNHQKPLDKKENQEILQQLLEKLPQGLDKEQLGPLYLFCFSYQQSLHFFDVLSKRLEKIRES